MTTLYGKDADAVLHELAHGTPDTPERIALFKRADAIYRQFHPQRRWGNAQMFALGWADPVEASTYAGYGGA